MTIKLIALDLDGTTLDNRAGVSDRNRVAIRKAIARGIWIVPATGRFLQGVPQPVRKIPGIRYMITSNGACIVDRHTGRPLFARAIPQEAAVHILKVAQAFSIYAKLYQNGAAYSQYEAEDRNLSARLRSLFTSQKKVEDLFRFARRSGKEIEKIELLIESTLAWKKIEAALEKYPLTVSTSGMNSMEITGYDVNKGTALARLCAHLSIAQEEVMALGDSGNDIQMLEWAGLGIAMENADPRVKKVADSMTLRNDQDGVALAIEKFALQ